MNQKLKAAMARLLSVNRRVATSLLLAFVSFTAVWASAPVSDLNDCNGAPGAVHVRGWCFDPDVPSKSIYVHVYVYKDAACSKLYRSYNVGLADESSTDVSNVYGIGGNHRFNRWVEVTTPGTYYVKTYALDGNGENANPEIFKGSTGGPFAVSVTAPYSITYNANGGSNAPAAQTKSYNINRTLSADEPTRDGYKFLGWNTLADGSGTSYAAGATYSANATVTLYAQWFGTDEQGNYLISSEEDWNRFAKMVANGETFSGKTVKLANNISVSTKVGVVSGSSRQKPFCGTFDGGNDTLTVNIKDTDNQGTAPFCFIKNATIRNLTVTGKVTGNDYHAAAIVGFNEGTSTIKHCTATATVNCGSHAGGILGHGLNSNITIDSCVFAGKIVGGDNAKGVLFGWGDNGGTKVVRNSLYVWQEGQDNKNLDLMKKYEGTVTVTNCYQTANVGSLGKTVLAEVPANSIAKQYTIYNTHCYESCTVSGVDDNYTLANGATLAIAPTVQFNGAVVAPENYSVAYTRNGEAVTQVAGSGDYTITVTGKEDKGYSGTWSKDFTVNATFASGFGQDNEGNYVIANTEAWNTFATQVANGETFSGKTVKLVQNISVSTKVGVVSGGTRQKPFSGTFDGGDKTLTVNIRDTDNQGTAPFCFIKDATIHNLTVTGKVTGNDYHAAAIVGFNEGTSIIKHCTATATVNGSSHAGGILGHGLNSNITIDSCVFAGKIEGGYNAKGVLYGWGDNGGTKVISNSLYVWQEGQSNTNLDLGKHNNDGASESYVNCYKTAAVGSYGTVVLADSTNVIAKQYTIYNTHYYIACTVTGVNDAFFYTGEPIAVVPVVQFNGTALSADDYTVTILYDGTPTEEVKARGTYTITVASNKASGYCGKWSKTFTVREKEIYTITYDANGGTGAPAAQTKVEGEELTLATAEPTREGYKFMGWCTVANGTHEYVDLGLPSGLKWATCNIGATKPEECGDYFAWGETEPYYTVVGNDTIWKDGYGAGYGWSTYKWCNGSERTLTKYSISTRYGTVDNITTLELSDDAANANWGGDWRMPTDAECKELVDNTTHEWITDYDGTGVAGGLFTASNGNTLFLPAAGSRSRASYGKTHIHLGTFGVYWSSSLLGSVCDAATSLIVTSINGGGIETGGGYVRYAGNSVRAVTAGAISSYAAGATYTANEAVTLYAQWKALYTIAYDANGGTGAPEAQTKTDGVDLTLTTAVPTREGYIFTGWNTMADGTGDSYAAGDAYTANAATTLYAQWREREHYTIAYDANGGTGAPEAQTKTEGEDLTLSNVVPVREGYKFMGWSIVVDDTHEYVDLGLPSGLKWATCNIGATQPEEYGDYFAWGETKAYGEADESNTMNYSYTSSKGSATYVKTYYDNNTYKYCNGGYHAMTKYCNNSSYGNNGFTDTLTTLDLADDAARANWGGNWRMPTHAEQEELLTNCTTEWTTVNGVYGRLFTSNINGKTLFLPAAGCCYMARFVDTGSVGTYWSSSLDESSPNFAQYQGFNSRDEGTSGSDRFLGFSVRAVTTISNYAAGATYTANAATTLYAQWDEAYTITYDANGGTGAPEPQLKAESEESITLTTAEPTREGYKFMGWDTEADGTGDNYAAGATYSANAAMTLYAQWEKVYTITYDANGGTGAPDAQTKIEGEDLTLATSVPVREGYKFMGWCTVADDTHEYVDLGLPSGLKWATCNIGATKPEEYGNYYAWGETKAYGEADESNTTNYIYTSGQGSATYVKTYYRWSTYKYCNGDFTKLTKYCNNSRYGNNGFTDTKTELDLADDAAHANWGGSWRMPTHAEQEELVNNCTTTWTTMNGVNGRLFTSKNNGKTLFLPAAGSRYEASLGDAGSRGHYWSSSLDSDYPSLAWIHGFNSIDVSASSGNRCAGQSVRAVAAIGNYAAGATYSANADVTLYAQWEDIRARYTIAYDANGGTGAPEAQTKIKDEDLTLATTEPTREGYKFMGWCTVANDTHEYVDLGLPSGLKWATCNIGATQPEEYGDYFAWGETKAYGEADESNTTNYSYTSGQGSATYVKTYYSWSTYKYCNGDYNTMTKYCNYSSYGNNGFTDTKTELDLADDAARANWGGSWRMPTHAEQEELLTNCTTEWTAVNGVYGRLFTSKINGKTLFLPAAGYRNGASLSNAGSYGDYWSSLNLDNPLGARILEFTSYDESTDHYGPRYYGRPVRAVCRNYTAGATYSANADVTLYAQWEKVYTITYDANGGTGAPDAQTKIEGEDLTLATTVPTREGYKFVGWKASNDAGHEYVDLGLPSGLMWATCNIGATQPEEYGDYFAWGDTTGYNSGKTTFNWSTYKYCNGSSSTMTKYCTNSSYGTVDNITTLDLADDAARANWGGDWRMPTHDEFTELYNNCTTTWTTVNGVYGRLFTSNNNGNTLFLPAAGYRNEASLSNAGSRGYYWSSSLYSDFPYGAWSLYFYSSGVFPGSSYYRCYGRSVRAVTAFSTYTAGATYSADADVTLYAQWELSEIAVANKGYNSEIIEAADGKSVKVTLADRTLWCDGDWNTLCLPFEVDLNDENGPLYGATARKLNSASITGTKLRLNFGNPVETLEAGVPYLIKWEVCTEGTEETEGTELAMENIVNPVFPGVTIDATDRSYDSDEDASVTSDVRVQFLGTYDLKTFNNEDQNILFLGAGNTLYYPDGTAPTTVGACRAYFKLGSEFNAAQLSSYSFIFGDEETVSIENHRLKDETDVWYTLDGRRLNEKPKDGGLYIHQGKKVMSH